MLIIIFGDIGVGKSTFAKALAEKYNLFLIQFDPLMESVTGRSNMYGEDGEFLLSDKEIEQVHSAMRSSAKELLESGKTVILESMFFKKQREEAIALAEKMAIPYKLIEVRCDEEEIKERIAKRFKNDKQSANISLFLENKGRLGDELRDHIILDTTSKSTEQCMKEVARELNL